MSTITVHDDTTLSSALSGAHGGDTILLAQGSYSPFSIQNLNFTASVTLQSLDPSHPAILTGFTFTNSSGFTFQNLQLDGTGYYAFRLYNSSNFSFLHNDFVGVDPNLMTTQAFGLGSWGGSNISVTNNEFHNLYTGLSLSATNGATVTGNYFHDMQSDGADFTGLSNAVISGNALSDFHVAPGDHPDAIQMWSDGSVPMSNITIDNNVVTRGDGDPIQGIFFTWDSTSPLYQNITVDGNRLVGTGYNGIFSSGASNLAISNNVLIAYPGSTNQTWIRLSNVDATTVTNNASVMYVFTPGPGLVSTGNVTNAALSNVANVDTVISPASLAMSGFVTHLVLTQAGLTGTANASGGSFLTSLQGGDTLVGSAAGNDTFIVAPGQPTDTITNFSLHDLVDISAFAALGLKPTFTDHGTYSTAQFTNGDTITFQGEPASLLATDASGNYIVDPPAAGPPPAPPPPAPPPPSSAPPPPPPAPPPPANTVTTSVSYTLPANGHNLTGTGSANLTLVGNALNNVITPNSGADTLTGHGGSDTFVFSPGQRGELVTDFNAHDQLDVSAYLAAGMTPSIQAHGGYSTVQFSDGDTIVLLGVHASTLHLNGHYIT